MLKKYIKWNKLEYTPYQLHSKPEFLSKYVFRKLMWHIMGRSKKKILWYTKTKAKWYFWQTQCHL